MNVSKGPMCLAIHTTYISQFAATFNDAKEPRDPSLRQLYKKIYNTRSEYIIYRGFLDCQTTHVMCAPQRVKSVGVGVTQHSLKKRNEIFFTTRTCKQNSLALTLHTFAACSHSRSTLGSDACME